MEEQNAGKNIEIEFDDQTIMEEQSVEENDGWRDKLSKNFKDKILIGCANVGRLWIRPVTKGKNKKKKI